MSQLYMKILKNPEVKKLLDERIKEIVGNLINPKALEKRINYFYNFYKVDMHWDIFCRNNIVETQYYSNVGANDKVAPTVEEVENQFNGNGDRQNLNNFIQQWIGGIANAYGVQIPKDPVTEGKYGTVGGKIMTLGSGDDDDKKDEKTSSAIVSSNYSMSLLYTLVCMLLVWVMN